MRTLQDFKEFILRESRTHSVEKFCRLSDPHRAFWEKLDRLGEGRQKGPLPEGVRDTDSVVELLDEGWRQLVREFHGLWK